MGTALAVVEGINQCVVAGGWIEVIREVIAAAEKNIVAGPRQTTMLTGFPSAVGTVWILNPTTAVTLAAVAIAPRGTGPSLNPPGTIAVVEIGAIGIARCFNYGGFKNRTLFDPAILPNMTMSKEEYKASSSPTINHFYEKLLLLKEKMNTKTGRRIAIARHNFMEQYLEQFYAEWDGKR